MVVFTGCIWVDDLHNIRKIINDVVGYLKENYVNTFNRLKKLYVKHKKFFDNSNVIDEKLSDRAKDMLELLHNTPNIEQEAFEEVLEEKVTDESILEIVEE
eukprot:UN08386